MSQVRGKDTKLFYSKNKENTTKLNTIKQFTKKILSQLHKNDISQEISYETLYDSNLQCQYCSS